MKTTLFLKRVDFFIQLAALLGPGVFFIVYQPPLTLMLCYILLGVMQPASYVLNSIYLDEFTKNAGRKVYERTLLALIVLFPIIAALDFIPFNLVFTVVMAISALLALLYLWVSYREMRFIAVQVDRKQYV